MTQRSDDEEPCWGPDCESPEPEEGIAPLHPVFFAVFGSLVVYALVYFAMPAHGQVGWDGDSRSVQVAAAPTELSGEALFAQRCAACHQATGQGVAGAFPPLVGSSWVLGDPETPARIVLRGLQGSIEVEGVTYAGAMPNFVALSDEEIARVLTYVRGAWGNDAAAVEAETVAKIRAEQAGNTAPWPGGDALQALREPPEASPEERGTRL